MKMLLIVIIISVGRFYFRLSTEKVVCFKVV